MSEFYYRYRDDVWDENGGIVVSRYRYPVVKRTPKGAWIECGGYPVKRRFVLDNARKKWAYPTLELAAESFRMRKKLQIAHCKQSIDRAAAVLELLGKTPIPGAHTVFNPDLAEVAE